MKWLLLFAPCICFSAQVIKIDAKQERVAISNPQGKQWEVGASVGLVGDEEIVAWGKVTKATAKGAIVQLTTRKSLPILVGYAAIASEPPPNSELPKTEEFPPEVKRPIPLSDGPPLSSPAAPLKAKPVVKAKPPAPKVVHQRQVMSHPRFRAIFDLTFSYRPKETPSLTFENSHSLLLLGIAPTSSMEFSFEVSSDPRFFELDYDLFPGLELRAGKIWIPFDDSDAHKMYGGRANIGRFLQPNSTVFLPEIWTDLGVGLKLSLLSTGGTEIAAHFYVVNGFGELSAGDPSQGTKAESYPDFGTILSGDNNDDKAIGGRLAMSVRDVLDFGASVYRGKYSNRGKSPAAVQLFGVDGRLRLGFLELKGGNIFAEAELINSPVPSFKRGGYYGELGVWTSRRLKWALRAGQSQNDSRILEDISDQSILGGIVTYRRDSVLLSLEYSKDLEKRTGKKNTEYAALRFATHF